MGKVILWELCLRLKFYDATKWHIPKTEWILEDKPHKILWGFELYTNLLIPPKRLELMMINKKNKNWTCCIEGFFVPADHSMIKRTSRKRDKYCELARELRKIIVFGAILTVNKSLEREMKSLEIWVQVETILTSILLRWARIMWTILETWGVLQSQRL